MSRTISVFSTKGGTGKTLLATNLSIALAQQSNKKVILLDLDMRVVGDTLRMLNTTPRYCAIDLISVLKEKEPTTAVEFLTHLPQYKIDFLPGVLKASQVAHLAASSIPDLISFLEKEYDYIVVDTGTAFSDILVNTFDSSNLILLVATPDILSVYQTKWSIDILSSLRFPLNVVKIVLNRSGSVGAVPPPDIKTALPCEFIASIPSEGKVVGLAINKGVPVIVDNPRCGISNAINRLARELIAKEKEIFIEHIELKTTLTKEEVAEKESGFWVMYKLAEAYRGAKEELEDEVVQLKRRVHQKLVEELDLKRLEIDMADSVKAQYVRQKVEKTITNILARETKAFLSNTEVRMRFIKEIADEVLGLGPLESLLADPEITDIMVNGVGEIYVERYGKLELTPKRCVSEQQLRSIIERILAPLGRRVDEVQPMVDARLADGSRVNAIIPPLSLSGPILTIRKFTRERLDIEQLLQLNTLNEPMKEFIEAAVKARLNIIVSGGSGSGKTTILNVLSAFIPNSERIITIEDAAELRLKQEHWVRLESRPPNIEGKGAITIRDLFRNTLRMRPDRIVIGECRGTETLDMLQAMNTGHDGSMTTIHANSTHDVLSRLDSMVLMAGTELPVRAIREMISSAVNIIIHTARLSDGSRKIMQITEVTGMLDELHVGLKDIYIFNQTGIAPDGKVLGNFQPTGYIPHKLLEEKFKIRGIFLNENIFKVPA